MFTTVWGTNQSIIVKNKCQLMSNRGFSGLSLLQQCSFFLETCNVWRLWRAIPLVPFFKVRALTRESYIHRLITVISQQAKWYEAKKYQIKGLLHLIYTPKVQHFIMLQKLSKCEVKAWLCWHLIILPPLRFYVKSNFGEFTWSKNVIFDNLRGSEFWF